MENSTRDSVHRLSRLCAETPEIPETKQGFALNSTGGVLIREDTLERRWRARNRSDGAAVPPVSNPCIALDLQLRRAEVASKSASITQATAVGTDKNVFASLAQCSSATSQLRSREAALVQTAQPSDAAWQELADDAYSLGKAMNAALLRLQLRSCLTMITDLACRTRGHFGQHEIYALAKLMEHLPHHDLPCVQVQALLGNAHQRSRGQAQGVDLDLAPWLSGSDRKVLKSFLDNSLVNAVLEDLRDHTVHQSKQDVDSLTCFDLIPEAVGLRDLRAGETFTPQMKNLVDLYNKEIQNQHVIFIRAQDDLYRSIKWDIDAYMNTEDGQFNAQDWAASYFRIATAIVAPHHHARFMDWNSLHQHLTRANAGRSLGCMKELFSDGMRLTVPEALVQGVKALEVTATHKQVPARLQDRLLTLRHDIDAIYREATGDDRLALELGFVLKVANQRTLGALRDRLADLTKAIEGRPKRPVARARSRANTEPSASASPIVPAPDSDIEVDTEAEAEAEAETQGEAAPVVSPAESAPSSAPPPKAVPVMWNNRPTPLRTRLSNDEVLQLIDDRMAAGTLGSPLRSAIYHYRRHVLRNAGPQPSDAQPAPNVTIEDYIHAALRRSQDWDGHTVTAARSGGNERLALVESSPRGWFTMDGRVVSYCFEDER